MSVSREVFNERKQEIQSYLDFVETIINCKARLTTPITKADPIPKEIPIPIELTHTLKANAFLLIYNIVEATMSNGIEEIHDEISTCDISSIDDLRDELITTILNRLIHGEMVSTEHLKHPASKQVLQYWLDDFQHCLKNNKNPLFAGNIDAKKIKEVSGKYGFSAETDSTRTKNGSTLRDVKSRRNDLAHGHVSFKECGSELAISDLIRIKDEVLSYLDEILKNIERYIVDKSFLRPALPTQSVLGRFKNVVLSKLFAS